MKRKQRLIVALALTVLLVAGVLVFRQRELPVRTPTPTAKPEITSQPPAPVKREIAAAKAPQIDKALLEQVNQKAGADFYQRFFREKILPIKNVEWLYQFVKGQLPASTETELLAMYIAEGPVRADTYEFMIFMTQLHAQIAAHSNELYELIHSEDALLKQDPFVYEMTMNLVNGLDLPPQKKSELLGSAFAQKFEVDERGNISLMSATMTNSLLFMKNAGIPTEMAKPYILKGIEANQDNSSALEEFLARVQTYYPDLEL